MPEATAVLFGFEDEFDCPAFVRLASNQVKVIIEKRAVEGACPACGVLSVRVQDRPLRLIKDLPASGQQVQLWWRKRRLVCAEPWCSRRSFTRTSDAIRPRARVSERLRHRVSEAIAASNRPCPTCR